MRDDRLILDARARVLARPLASDGQVDRDDMLDLLVVRISGQTALLTMGSVVGIVRAAHITPLPHVAPPVLGLAAWRGRPLTVLSVARRIASAEGEHLVVLGDGRRELAALLVDDVEDVVTLDRRTILPAEQTPLASYALGMTADARLVLDATKIIEVLGVRT